MALLHGFLGRLHFGEAQIVYQNSDGAELENQHKKEPREKPIVLFVQFFPQPAFYSAKLACSLYLHFAMVNLKLAAD